MGLPSALQVACCRSLCGTGMLAADLHADSTAYAQLLADPGRLAGGSCLHAQFACRVQRQVCHQRQVCLTGMQPVPLRGCATMCRTLWDLARKLTVITSVLCLEPLLLNKSSATGTHQFSPQGSSSCTPADTSWACTCRGGCCWHDTSKGHLITLIGWLQTPQRLHARQHATTQRVAYMSFTD